MSAQCEAMASETPGLCRKVYAKDGVERVGYAAQLEGYGEANLFTDTYRAAGRGELGIAAAKSAVEKRRAEEKKWTKAYWYASEALWDDSIVVLRAHSFTEVFNTPKIVEQYRSPDYGEWQLVARPAPPVEAWHILVGYAGKSKKVGFLGIGETQEEAIAGAKRAKRSHLRCVRRI